MHDGRLCFGYHHGVARVFNTSTYECEMELGKLTKLIFAIIQLLDGRLCTGSNDENQATGECKATFEGRNVILLYFNIFLLMYAVARLMEKSDYGINKLGYVTTRNLQIWQSLQQHQHSKIWISRNVLTGTYRSIKTLEPPTLTRMELLV
jgi:hypothetical protein